MEITFQTAKIEKLCKDPTYATRRLGKNNAIKLQRRLDDILAAEKVSDIVAGKPHPLGRDRRGQLSISLVGGTRLVIKPNHDPIPRKSDGSIDWAAVTAATVCYIGDYHD